MNTSTQFLVRVWRGAVLVICLGLLAYLLYFHRLQSLLPGFNSSELQTYRAAGSWHNLAANPVNWLFGVPVWLLTAVWHHGPLMTRMVAAGWGLVAGLLFYAIVRLRYSFFVALLGTVLFTTSAGFLHAARLGSGLVLQMGVLALIGAVLAYQRLRQRRVLAGYGLAVLLAICCYIPGLLWFALLGLSLFQSGLRRQLRRTPLTHVLGWSVVTLAGLLPLILAAIHQPHVILTAAGLPGQLPGPLQLAKNLLSTTLTLGVRSHGDPLWGVGHAPLLNTVELGLALIGAYVYLVKQRSARGLFLASSIVLGIVLISLGGPVSYACLVPLVYLFVVSGLNLLLGQWLQVFPRNPIARLAGYGLICAMLTFSVLYQVRSYFVAWPHATATRQAFRLPPPE